MKSILSTKNLSLMALMSALLCLLAPISIPIGPVPITLSIFIIYIISYILDANSALISVFIYLLIGIVGLPVFAGYKSGLGVILGPSGGYLISYLVVVYISSYYNHKYYYNKILQLLFTQLYEQTRRVNLLTFQVCLLLDIYRFLTIRYTQKKWLQKALLFRNCTQYRCWQQPD